jgi:hypothetical protein
MQDPDSLRAKAAQCRRLAERATRRFPRRRGNYLLVLADRLEREAALLARGHAAPPPEGGVVVGAPRA